VASSTLRLSAKRETDRQPRVFLFQLTSVKRTVSKSLIELTERSRRTDRDKSEGSENPAALRITVRAGGITKNRESLKISLRISEKGCS